jgi:hypothetical protein
MADPPLLAEVCDYPSLLEAFRARIAALGTTGDALDELCLFGKGMTSKFLRNTPGMRMSTLSMLCLLMALGCKFVMVEDLAQLARVKQRLSRTRWTEKRLNRLKESMDANGGMRTEYKPRKVGAKRPSPFKGNSQWGRQMALRRRTLLTPAFIQRQCSAAARARWSFKRRIPT